MRKNKLTFLLIHPEISRTKYNFVGIIENECLELEYISSMLKEKMTKKSIIGLALIVIGTSILLI